MKEKIINSYVNKLTKDDIISFSAKNGIYLTNDEIEIILETIKRDWKEILNNPNHVLSNLQGKISDNAYNNIINFYNLYSDKLSLL